MSLLIIIDRFTDRGPQYFLKRKDRIVEIVAGRQFSLNGLSQRNLRADGLALSPQADLKLLLNQLVTFFGQSKLDSFQIHRLGDADQILVSRDDRQTNAAPGFVQLEFSDAHSNVRGL